MPAINRANAMSVFIVVVALTAFTAATSGCSKSGSPSASATPAPVATVTKTTTVTETATPSAAPVVEPTKPSPSAATTALMTPRDFGFVRQVITKEGGKALVWDRAALLTGSAAAKAKKAHGINPTEPPDYYILNDSTKQRIYPLASGYTVIGSTFFGKPPAGAPVSRAKFESAFPSKTPPAMYVYFDDAGQVTKVVELYVP